MKRGPQGGICCLTGSKVLAGPSAGNNDWYETVKAEVELLVAGDEGGRYTTERKGFL